MSDTRPGRPPLGALLWRLGGVPRAVLARIEREREHLEAMTTAADRALAASPLLSDPTAALTAAVELDQVLGRRTATAAVPEDPTGADRASGIVDRAHVGRDPGAGRIAERAAGAALPPIDPPARDRVGADLAGSDPARDRVGSSPMVQAPARGHASVDRIAASRPGDDRARGARPASRVPARVHASVDRIAASRPGDDRARGARPASRAPARAAASVDRIAASRPGDDPRRDRGDAVARPMARGPARAPAAPTAEAARAWLIRRAERAGGLALLGRIVGTATTATDQVSTTGALDSAIAPANLEPRSAGSAPAMTRLVSLVDRLAPGLVGRAPGDPGEPETAVHRDSPGDDRRIAPPAAARRIDDRTGELAALAGRRALPPVIARPIAGGARGPADGPGPGEHGRAITQSADPADRAGAPVAERADPRDAGPPVASAPRSPLRRFALMAEAPAPPAPGSPAPAPSIPAPPTPALDDADLAERIDRILRREARRDGLDLDP